MAKISWSGAAISAPIPPALVICGTNEKPNILTIAWTGIVNTDPPTTYISVRPSRYSYSIIRESGEFTINFPTTEIAKAVDICGVYTGRKVDKFERCRLHHSPSSQLSCPILDESPISLECKVISETELGSHSMFIAQIVAVDVDDRFIDESGKLHLEKAHLLAYAHGSYYELGKRIGARGYAVRKKTHKPTAPQKQGD